jgi:hypothetical protein
MLHEQAMGRASYPAVQSVASCSVALDCDNGTKLSQNQKVDGSVIIHTLFLRPSR